MAVIVALFVLALIWIPVSAVSLSCSCHQNWTHVLTTDANGVVTFGSKTDLISAAMTGSDVRIYMRLWVNYYTSVQNLHTVGDNICGQALFHIGKATWRTFQDNAYWWFLNVCTTGSVQMMRYYVGKHVSVSTNVGTYQMKWFVRYTDTCWQLAYQHDSAGNGLQGSLEMLRSAAESGHRVKLLIGDMSVEPDEVRIRGAHVNAIILSKVLKDSSNIKEFDSEGVWDWSIVTTTGTQTTLRLRVGEAIETTGSRVTTTTAVTWFIDTRPWRKVLAHDEFGTVTSGSKAALTDAVMQGARIRYIMGIDEIGSITIHKADNIDISGADIGAMHVRSVSVEKTPRSTAELRFKTNPYWCFTMAVTTGFVDMSRWTK
ncbi:hypothetical protein MAR_004665 [Mya arenaria]|uniref:Uncharacterized protein n=1 Tax=Mya arenaria TaxID=6604 RepID=A0ABY7EYU7_MYAAR|nr:hypothetical protein MAR_004665 [Mya arenaria]